MAKGKSGRKGTREPLDSLPIRVRSWAPPTALLTEIDDHRTYTKSPATRPALTLTGAVAGIQAITPKRGTRSRTRVPYQIAFTAPKETLVCVRRSRRRQVLHALKKTGKRGQRRRRRSQWSNIKC